MNQSLSRQFIILIVSTVVVFAFQPYCTTLLEHLIKVFHWLSLKLRVIFAHSYWADLIRLSLSALVISTVIGAVLAIGYKFIRKKPLPNPMLLIWVTWLLIIARII